MYSSLIKNIDKQLDNYHMSGFNRWRRRRRRRRWLLVAAVGLVQVLNKIVFFGEEGVVPLLFTGPISGYFNWRRRHRRHLVADLLNQLDAVQFSVRRVGLLNAISEWAIGSTVWDFCHGLSSWLLLYIFILFYNRNVVSLFRVESISVQTHANWDIVCLNLHLNE